MALTPERAEEIAKSGISALGRGDARTARTLFEQVVASQQAGPGLYMLLSRTCRELGDPKAAETAVDALLQHFPNDVRGLIAKGDAALLRRDDRAAQSFFGAAAEVAGQMQPVPPELIPELTRAGSLSRDISARYLQFLDGKLLASDIVAQNVNGRFGRSLELLTGSKSIYLQQPTTFYYPELPQIQFYEREDFPWAAALEAATPDILRELQAVLAAGVGFEPYVEAPQGRAHHGHSLMNDPRWGAYHLWRNGELVEDNAARCPSAIAALRHAPIPDIRTRSPMALFSRLQPGTHIPPHNGMINTRLICHLPLIVPPGCRFRVGNEVREWEVGKLIIFDDSVEHEAWNDGDAERVILLFEVWRPELSESERAALTVLFEAINDYGTASA